MVLVSIAFVAVVLELVRRRRLKEEYSLLWLLAGAVMMILSVFRPLLERVAAFLGIFYAPSALFLVTALIAMAVGLHFTAVISTLTDQNRILAQRVALLEAALGDAAIEGATVAQGGAANDPKGG
jgi:hypothetical protein